LIFIFKSFKTTTYIDIKEFILGSNYKCLL